MATRRKAATTKKPAARPAAKPAARSPGIGALSIGALLVAAGAALVGAVVRARQSGGAEHEAPDLALDQPRPGADDRAPIAFRPDPTAPVSAAERESLRPATGPAPSMVN
jgi:hypothetical protein